MEHNGLNIYYWATFWFLHALSAWLFARDSSSRQLHRLLIKLQNQNRWRIQQLRAAQETQYGTNIKKLIFELFEGEKGCKIFQISKTEFKHVQTSNFGPKLNHTSPKQKHYQKPNNLWTLNGSFKKLVSRYEVASFSKMQKNGGWLLFSQNLTKCLGGWHTLGRFFWLFWAS